MTLTVLTAGLAAPITAAVEVTTVVAASMLIGTTFAAGFHAGMYIGDVLMNGRTWCWRDLGQAVWNGVKQGAVDSFMWGGLGAFAGATLNFVKGVTSVAYIKFEK